jgi:hypothetical protein
MHTYIEHNISKFVPSLPGERLLESQPTEKKQNKHTHTQSNKHTFPINIAMGKREIDRSIDRSWQNEVEKRSCWEHGVGEENLIYPSQELTLILLLLLLLLLLQLTLLLFLLFLLLLLMSQLNSLLVRENLEEEVC